MHGYERDHLYSGCELRLRGSTIVFVGGSDERAGLRFLECAFIYLRSGETSVGLGTRFWGEWCVLRIL